MSLESSDYMQCPRCRTNIYGNLDKCTVCGYTLNNPQSSIKEKSTISNGILDPTNINDYSKKLNQNMNGLSNNNKFNNNSTNIKYAIPIIILLVIIIIIFIIGIISIITN